MSAVVITAVITPAEGKQDAVREAFQRLLPIVHQEDGCDLYALHESDGKFVTIEKWASQEAFEGHANGDSLQKAGVDVASLAAGPSDWMLLTPVPSSDGSPKGEL
ncbi:putative quinol monooxygenase [Flexivirga meconopsidis]|uniref:putative quinol monooxygenase n=1 Tax=Flexivirga meconopsidis TaxID=2977121 RepID=UPI00223E9010|nr:antibiotic biosynthesis monooxygenase family protein [Flexivirga meconopsidis]